MLELWRAARTHSQRELSNIGIQRVFEIDGGECSKSSIGVDGY
jgi:hypothetical protein